MDREDKFYILACQKAQVNIQVVGVAFVSFTKCPKEGSNGFVADLVFKTVFDITTGRAAFATDQRTEAITVLYSERRERSLNKTI